MSNKVDLCVHDIEYAICHVGNLWRRLLGEKIKELNVSIIEKRSLFAISRYPGFTQVQIANMLEIEPQNFIRVLDNLEKQKYVVREPNPDDRRVKCLYLTKEGGLVVEKIKVIGKKIKPRILAGLQSKEIEATLSYLGRMRENIMQELVE